MLLKTFVLKIIVRKLNVFEYLFYRPMRLLPHSLRHLVSMFFLHFLRNKLILKCSPILLKILNDLIDIYMKDPRQLSMVLIKIRQHIDFVRKLLLLV